MSRAQSGPDAFLSYSLKDKSDDGGAISEFRRQLAAAVHARTGKPFNILQDVDRIELGENWTDKIDRMLDQVHFFIPIITPSFFATEACREELEKFLRVEAARGRNELVLPVYYIECDVLEDQALRAKDPLATAIHGRHHLDWRKLRHKPFAAPEVRAELERLAETIVRARRPRMPPNDLWKSCRSTPKSPIKNSETGEDRRRYLDSDAFVKGMSAHVRAATRAAALESQRHHRIRLGLAGVLSALTRLFRWSHER